MTSALSLTHKLSRSTLVRDRTTWVLAQCSGKRVLHVGCADTGVLHSKLARGNHLHYGLEAVCSDLIGLDSDEAAIAELKSLGHGNLVCANIQDSQDAVIDEVSRLIGGLDVILCGEVLEHVLDMGAFLAGVRAVAAAFEAKVIITVPNAFSVERFVPAVFGSEHVHPDHKCYFSQITLGALLSQCAFKALAMHYYSNEKLARTRFTRLAKILINRSLLAISPQLAQGLIAVAEPA